MKNLLFALALSMPLHAMADWEAPANPDPRAILHEAFADYRAGRFEDALAKHVWFHQYALEYRPSLYGSRLAPALMGWYELGKAYPPAMKKLKETRDEAARQVVEAKDNVRELFDDMSSINEQLGDEDRTAAIFVRLDKEAPEAAKKVYELAQPALVKAKKIAVCGKYLEPEKSYPHMVELHGLDLKFAEDETSLARKRREREVAESIFLERAATLIALLVLNDRKPEAEKIAERARSESKHLDRDQLIDTALEGKLPKLRIE